MNVDHSFNNFFDTPFGGSQGPPTGSSGSLFGLNNHGGLMNNLGPGFEGPPRERNDSLTPSQTFSLGGPAMNDTSFGQTSNSSRSRNDRSVSPRGRPPQGTSLRPNHQPSLTSQTGRVGASGPTDPLGLRNDQTTSQPDLGVYACTLATQTLKNFEAMSLQAGLDPASHKVAMIQAELMIAAHYSGLW
ncbi:uncharacterized protein MELLADRAFT_64547 [Melampsora larici-populina 98AG31]|uniref:Uncharacterized protein n=1 Tax=Melampsora larici-populina (strain 98AG31 / pathotype 3-4-7) TaxID=747676 RepID=F4RRU8_MELLP|nr:uncharacterized protein MELLADRAFT_64547 [Melampsora larici-populina 98AG31]EGG04743.1 hypothetical protein MELLADRAFT_64547 [Melampsora larici-populina 98AG31]